ncbi:hypothetical protein CN645_11855 [Burkholderia sp. IDO3]|nr:hypothetical protein DCN14_24030 [Burkholderia sp. IDO3]PCD61467.1 hypothetical protein CN645_11855 [Burkholderia sp. IDO3]
MHGFDTGRHDARTRRETARASHRVDLAARMFRQRGAHAELSGKPRGSRHGARHRDPHAHRT